MINKLSKEIHSINVKNGFYEGKKNIGEMIALCHSELSEALEADRKAQYSDWDNFNEELKAQKDHEDGWKSSFQIHIKDTFEDELADTMIRIMDMSAYLGIDLESHIRAKMRYNSFREYKHGKNY